MTDTQTQNKEQLDETETPTVESGGDEKVTVTIEKTNNDETEVSETDAEHAVDLAERASELAQLNAAKAIADNQEFITWCKTEFQTLTQTVNEIAQLQVNQAEIVESLLTSTPQTSTELPLETETEAEVVTIQEIQQEVASEAEADPQEVTQIENLQNQVQRVKQRIRIL